MRHRDALIEARRGSCWLGLLIGLLAAPAVAAERKWNDFVEPEFPFFSSVVDGRRLGNGLPADNLTPRGIVLNLGQSRWAVFDVDLLRFSVLWEGDGVSPVSMAQGSYHESGRKAPEGQDALPTPLGQVWLATGVYPGFQFGDSFRRLDPRDPTPDPREVGRGALPASMGRFGSLDFSQSIPVLRYVVEGVEIQETVEADGPGGRSVRRRIHLGPTTLPAWIAVGHRSVPKGAPLRIEVLDHDGVGAGGRAEWVEMAGGLGVVRVPPKPRGGTVEIRVGRGEAGVARDRVVQPRSGRRWPDEIVTAGRVSEDQESYVVDRIPLPSINPWRRQVRLGDLAFRSDGVAFGVTFDGDVWRMVGLEGDLSAVRWCRYSSGLHEPLGICVRGEEVFVHDRNGIWRLDDRDGDGEADCHVLYAATVSQTAETREFASGLRLMPDGSFVIGKGGQRGATLGRHSGQVMRISRDGRTATVLGHGFRQPFIGVHPTEGWVSVSDQQGHYVPTTPLYLLGSDRYHGFRPLILPKNQHEEPIEEPLVWIPHAVNASGAGQVWLSGARMGPLTGGLLHLGYYRPEVFAVLGATPGAGTGATVLSLTKDLDFAPLAGAVGVKDGHVYLTGFQIWGSTAKDISGLARLRHTGMEDVLPLEVEATASGIRIRFGARLEESGLRVPGSFVVERWNYIRSAEYGSPHVRLDGAKGHDVLPLQRVCLTQDRRSVFLAVSDMKPSMQMRVGWSLRTAAGMAFVRSAYLSPRVLKPFVPDGQDFVEVSQGGAEVKGGAGKEGGMPDTMEGGRLAEVMGCVACHSVDGTLVGKVGPSWKGLWGSERRFVDGTKALADETYLRESMRQPAKRVVAGFQLSDAGMPSYEGVLTEGQETALIRYIESVR